MKKQYKHIFFDLDHTLWDFEKNSHETLVDLYHEHDLLSRGIDSADEFIKRYKFRNEFLWGEYRKQKIKVEELRVNRFITALADFNVTDKVLAYSISEKYMEICPDKLNLLPYAMETLNYLKGKYSLHIITNGFHEVQIRKVRNTSLEPYFENIFTSDLAGCLKPEKAIFTFSLNGAKAVAEESIYIGDSLEVDVSGARNAGMDQVYFNCRKLQHKEEITFEVDCLSGLQKIF